MQKAIREQKKKEAEDVAALEKEKTLLQNARNMMWARTMCVIYLQLHYLKMNKKKTVDSIHEVRTPHLLKFHSLDTTLTNVESA